MTRQPFHQEVSEQRFAEALQRLSAREQIGLLVRATRQLPGRERVEVWRVAGVSVMRDRFLPLLLHILLKRILAGTLWWIICGVSVVLLLLVLVQVEQINAQAVGPVLATISSFLAGFLLFALIDFLRSLIQFFRTTCPRRTREELFARLNACDHAQKIALLRLVSASLAGKVPGESLLASLITGFAFFVAAAILIVLVVLLCTFLPVVENLPGVLLIACVAFLLGLLGPRQLQHRLLTRHS